MTTRGPLGVFALQPLRRRRPALDVRSPRFLSAGIRGALRPMTRVRAGVAGERGSGGITGVAVIGVLCALLLAMAPIGGALSARQQLQGAADAAALAAADTASGRVAGSPCDAAASLASSLEASLTTCAVDLRGVATVGVMGIVLGVGVEASARAGPPGIP